MSAGEENSQQERENDRWWEEKQTGMQFNHLQTARVSIIRMSKAHFKFILSTKKSATPRAFLVNLAECES